MTKPFPSLVFLFLATVFTSSGASAAELPASTRFDASVYNTARVIDKDSTDEFNPMCKYRVIIRTEDREDNIKDYVQSVVVTSVRAGSILVAVEIDNNIATSADPYEPYESSYQMQDFVIGSENKTVIEYNGCNYYDKCYEGFSTISRDNFDLIEENCLKPVK